MLTPFDEHIGHQLPTTFDHVVSSDPAWTERRWFTLHDIEARDVMLNCGLGYYPNKNVMDAFAGVAYRGKQYNIRMSRELRPHPLEEKVGPFSIHVVEGLKKVQLLLEESDAGINFDVEWEAAMNPHEEENHFDRRRGKVVEDMARYSQQGRGRGTIRIPGKTFELRPDTWWGQRDRSWGVRRGIGSEPQSAEPPPSPAFFFNWATAQFRDYGFHWHFIESAPGQYSYITGEEVRPQGQPADPGRRVVAIEHDFRWAQGAPAQTVTDAEITFRLADGERKTLHLKPLPTRYFLASGMYFRGYKGWTHGAWKGAYHCEHDVWDLSKDAVLTEAGTFGDHMMEYRCGDDIGYGIIEYGVAPGYPKYKEVQNVLPV